MPILNSSAIARAEYDPNTRRMQIWFRGGMHAYDYFNVPESVYQGLIQAPSAGSYYARYIKDYFRYF
ncbi:MULTISPECIES: KTSC domain-containing protein [unclassified Methylobacterium]|uniref:KTSC domain-containing protein n=1 Tax=unclassified Methylobacterium TaxID=2615210 RepID=UPI0011C20C9E|nr:MULTISPECIES: KTSC domain-containing protein [unclassified Methylobacterium]QEE38833.1 KTSC domain-containing protein [Methylobacterium sp. WL1]TXN53611.1 KTSC domain-containing protein [Methylobacterium sp. WL2]